MKILQNQLHCYLLLFKSKIATSSAWWNSKHIHLADFTFGPDLDDVVLLGQEVLKHSREIKRFFL